MTWEMLKRSGKRNFKESMGKNLPQKKDQQADIFQSVELSPEEIRGALVDAGSKAFAREIPFFNKIFGVIDQVHRELRDKQLNSLLQQFNAKLDSNDETIKRLNALFSEPNGVALFGKITSILNNGSYNEEWIGLLSNALKKISDVEIKERFDELEYILSQIARLSPQALIILSKGDKWRTARLSGGSSTSKETLLGDWDMQIAKFFAANVGITERDTISMLAHTFRELETANMIYLTTSKTVECREIGARVQNLIS